MSDSSAPKFLEPWAGFAWRFVAIVVAVIAAGYVLSALRVVLIPLAVAAMITTVIEPIARAIERRGARPLLAAWAAFGVLTVVVAGGAAAVIIPVSAEFSVLGGSLDDAIDDFETWSVEGPLGLEPERALDIRSEIEATASTVFSFDGVVRDGALVAGELLAGALFTAFAAFFLVKDGEMMQRFALRHVSAEYRDRVSRAAASGWLSLRRFLLGAAVLGLVEGVVIGITLGIVGSPAALPAAVLTFALAFLPFVGAIVAGVVAVLLAFVAGGPGAAVALAVVAIVLQQFDNELLAPFVYGRLLFLHPLVVVTAMATGVAVGGFVGALFAVPITAVVVSAAQGAHEAD